jgi:hypothetical protein
MTQNKLGGVQLSNVTTKVLKPKVAKPKKRRKQTTLGNAPVLIKNNSGKLINVQGLPLEPNGTRRVIVDQEIKTLEFHKYILYIQSM